MSTHNTFLQAFVKLPTAHIARQREQYYFHIDVMRMSEADSAYLLYKQAVHIIYVEAVL